MIEHQLEALQSEAWGVSGDEHTLDFARRVRELLEAQEFETGHGSLEDLPDIVRHICGHADAIERRRERQRLGLPPWQQVMADYLRRAWDMTPKEKMQEIAERPYLGSLIFAGNEKADMSSPFWELAAPLTNRLIHIGVDTSGSVSPEDIEEFAKGAEGMFGPPGNPPEGEPTRSDIIREAFERKGIPVIDIKMSERLIDPADLLGIPIINKKDETVEWALPKGPMGHHRKQAAVFLDEYIAADPAKIKAINAIKLERERGEQSE